MHPLTLTLFTLLPSTLALPRKLSTPQPSLTNITYWGSACPPDKSGLTTVLGPPSTNTTNTTSFPLSFTLSNFLPTLDGSFGSSLRMCDIVSTVTIGNDDDEETPGWKVVVNKRGTGVSGEAKVPGNATMFLRGTYAFVESSEKQVCCAPPFPSPFFAFFVLCLFLW
ncbi:unnamed protein product [Periconia digitata]|uniref:Uncharacterized protein n=1 Tax=Periconia digitata TaxID=1303443 RepID=A0A9W4XPY4_9PLEO|nr:unnamed protein product [Periconia digitata]